MSEVTFAIEETPDGYSWKLLTADGKVIAVSSQPHATLDECRESIEKVRQSRGAQIREPENG